MRLSKYCSQVGLLAPTFNTFYIFVEILSNSFHFTKPNFIQRLRNTSLLSDYTWSPWPRTCFHIEWHIVLRKGGSEAQRKHFQFPSCSVRLCFSAARPSIRVVISSRHKSWKTPVKPHLHSLTATITYFKTITKWHKWPWLIPCPGRPRTICSLRWQKYTRRRKHSKSTAPHWWNASLWKQQSRPSLNETSTNDK